MNILSTSLSSYISKRTFLKNSLLGNTLFVVGLAAFLAAGLFILITLSIVKSRFERQAKEGLEELVSSMNSMAAVACFAKDATLAVETVQAFIKNRDVYRVTIVAYDKPLASATRSGTVLPVEEWSPERRAGLISPLFSPFNAEERIGSIELVPNWPGIEEAVSRTVRHMAIMLALLAAGIVGAIALVVTLLVVRPVKIISDRLHSLNAIGGDTLRVPAKHERNELGRLVHDINGLIARFRSSLEQEHELRLQQVVNERLRLSSAVFEHAQEGILITDKDNRIVTVNRAFTHITGYSAADAFGENPKFLSSGRQDKTFYEQMWQSINSLGYWRGELWNRSKNGEIKPKWISINVVKDDDGNIVNHIAIFTDISERKMTEEKIEFLAHHDALTKLPNRILTRDRFEQAVASAKRDRSRIAMIYLDLDNFKYVNDSFGHQAGDQLLLLMVERLKRHIRDTDTISRQGGDEFLILLPGIENDDTLRRIANLILSEVASSFDIENQRIGISASMGITRYPDNGLDFDTLLNNADTAMYAAKASGKNTFRIFSDDLNVDSLDKLKLKAQLRTALDNQEFLLHYQPQINIPSGRIIGAEALIRWNHPELGIVPPGRFIPLAEESGMINEIGTWVIEEACRQGKQWFDSGIPAFVIAVNISAQQFNKDSIYQSVQASLTKTGFPPEYLELEFTESGLLANIQHTLATIEKLRTLGVKLSIDDFGTGYSSLSYLKQFKVEKLKIDQSFVRDLSTNPEEVEIIRAIIQLGKTLQMNVIAEGVETDDQLQILTDLECHEAQGYLISHPLSANDFDRFVAEHARRDISKEVIDTNSSS